MVEISSSIQRRIQHDLAIFIQQPSLFEAIIMFNFAGDYESACLDTILKCLEYGMNSNSSDSDYSRPIKEGTRDVGGHPLHTTKPVPAIFMSATGEDLRCVFWERKKVGRGKQRRQWELLESAFAHLRL